jgi:arginase family enzyme
VNLPSLEPELARDRMTEGAAALRRRARLPVFLGGDHSVTYPVLRAYADEPELHVVQIDAHLDFTLERNSTRYSNSSPFRRASEELPGLRQVTTLGLRGLRFDREAIEAARARGNVLVPAWEMAGDEHLSRLPEGRRVYLSIDLDALDPAVFPATSSPEPDGLSFRQVLAIVQETAHRNTIVGLDIVEMTPHLDPSGNSSLLAARLLIEAVAAVLDP